MNETIKIGGVKYNLKDLDPKLRERIEEQLRNSKESERDNKKAKTTHLKTNNKMDTDNKNKTSVLRKMFGYRSGIFEK